MLNLREQITVEWLLLNKTKRLLLPPKDIAGILNNYFTSVYTSEDESTIPTLDGINFAIFLQ